MKRTLLHPLCILFLLTSPGVAQQAATPARVSEATSAANRSSEEIWTDLMAGNARYVAGQTTARSIVQLRESLAKDQHPKVAVLACSDSRVGPETVFDKSLGDLFVVRSAGNIADAIGVGSLEYAVQNLGSSVILVMGHTSCGAVKAACSGDKMPTSNLQAIVDKIDPAVSLARNQAKGDALLDAAIRDNVHQSSKDLLDHSDVLRKMVSEGKLTIIQAVYHLDSGKVERLEK
jgi:carbonic anhydrase